MGVIYHITSAEEWNNAKMKANDEGQFFYSAASLDTEGFIHCSKEDQVKGVLQRYFEGKEGLVKLVIEPERLSSPVKFEKADSIGEDFPHVYGPINSGAVTEVIAL